LSRIEAHPRTFPGLFSRLLRHLPSFLSSYGDRCRWRAKFFCPISPMIFVSFSPANSGVPLGTTDCLSLSKGFRSHCGISETFLPGYFAPPRVCSRRSIHFKFHEDVILLACILRNGGTHELTEPEHPSTFIHSALHPPRLNRPPLLYVFRPF